MKVKILPCLARASAALIFFIAADALSALTKAEFIALYGDKNIHSLKISGNDKTKEHVIANHLRHALNAKISQFDEETARNELIRLGFIRDVQFNFTTAGGPAALEATVTEKWTLIPLPVASSSRGINTFGGFLLETNLLGYGKTVFAGVLGSNRGWESFAGYVDRSLFSSHFRLNIMARIGDKAFEYGKSVKTIEQRYQDRFQTALGQWGYEFSRGLIFGLSAEVQKHERIDDAASYHDAGISVATLFVPGLYLQIDRLIVRGYYREGWAGFIRVGPSFVDGKAETIKLTGFLRYTTGGFSDHAMGISSRGSYTKVPAIAEDRLGGIPDSKTLPLALISADAYLGGSIFYEVPVLQLNWAIFTLQGFFEAGMYDNEREANMQMHYGPGLGARMYLDKFAIPALGLDATYALQSREYIISAALGLTF